MQESIVARDNFCGSNRPYFRYTVDLTGHVVDEPVEDLRVRAAQRARSDAARDHAVDVLVALLPLLDELRDHLGPWHGL